ncbi:MAG: porin [Verrucomicrobiota bacterium]|jgi:phosphate-selective porin OprO/OprP
MTRNYRWIVAAAIGTQLIAASALADDTADAIAALKKQIDALSAKVQQLENQHQAEMQHPAGSQPADNIAAAGTASTNTIPEPGYVTAGSNGFWLRSADSNYTLRLQGVGQLDGHYYKSVNPGQKDSLTIRRMRLIESGSVFKDYDYYVQEDFGALNSATTTNNSLLQDAYVNIHYWPGFQIQGGKFKELVNLEWQPADANLWFVERSYPSELVPNRNVGIQVHGDLFHGALSYAAGMYNGLSDGGSGDIETDSNSKDVAARIFAQPFTNTSIAALQGFGLGLGASYGYEVGSSLPSFATVGRQTFFSFSNNAAAAQVTEAGDHVRLAPQGWYFWGPAGLFWEYAYSSEKFQLNKTTAPKITRAFFDNTAWDVTASWYLTGEKNNLLTPPAPLRPFHPDGSGLGAWQLVARVGGLDVDPAAFAKKADFAGAGSAQSAATWSVGLNWLMNKNIKWIFEYDQTRFGFAPGWQAAKGTVAAQDEKALLTRLQFAF